MPPPNNRLALPARNAMLDPNALGQTVPVPYIPGTTPAPDSRFVPGREIENLSIGIGRGITGQLEGAKQMLTDPVGTVRSVLEAARQIGADPITVLRMLQSARQQAMSGGLGAGEMIGGMLPMPGSMRGAVKREMSNPNEFMRRREQQLLNEEDVQHKEITQALAQDRHLRNLQELKTHGNWIDQTQKQATVVSKLKDLGLPVSTTARLNRWDDVASNIVKAEDPFHAYQAKELINRYKSEIDQDFSDYLSAVRKYREGLNMRSKYDRANAKDIDSILGDTRVTQFQRD